MRPNTYILLMAFFFTEDLSTCRKNLKSSKMREAKLVSKNQKAKVRAHVIGHYVPYFMEFASN